jgi:hypothetical protein
MRRHTYAALPQAGYDIVLAQFLEQTFGILSGKGENTGAMVEIKGTGYLIIFLLQMFDQQIEQALVMGLDILYAHLGKQFQRRVHGPYQRVGMGSNFEFPGSRKRRKIELEEIGEIQLPIHTQPAEKGGAHLSLGVGRDINEARAERREKPFLCTAG